MGTDEETDGEARPAESAALRWFRHDRYEIRDGLIRPAPKARVEPYFPWRGYEAARSGWGGRSGKAPYEALLDLAWSVRLLPGPAGESPRLDPRSERAVLAFCAQHGLLGLLPHATHAAYLAPAWLDTWDRTKAEPLPLQRTYTWDAHGWHTIDDVDERALLPGAPVEEHGTPAAADWWKATWVPPQVLLRPLGDAAWTRLPIGVGWGRYFPDVPPDRRATHPYPEPNTYHWWFGYAEPLDGFLEAAALFADALRELVPEPVEGEDMISWLTREAAADRVFSSFLSGVHPAFSRHPERDRGLRRTWRTKSLLAAFALMAWVDLTSGMRLLRCEVCGRPFVAGGQPVRYCSARCRNTAVKRAYRERLRGRAAAPDETDQAHQEEASRVEQRT